MDQQAIRLSPDQRAGIGCLTALVVPVPFVAWFYVVSLATSGSYQWDAFRPASRVFLAWTPVAVAIVVGAVLKLKRRAGSGSLMLAAAGAFTVFAIGGATAFTLAHTRNDAPDGRRFDESFSEAADRTSIDVESVLTDVAPGRWELRDDPEFFRNTTMCTDTFGRKRGAITGSNFWVLEPTLEPTDVQQIARSLNSRPGRVAWVDDLDPLPEWNGDVDFAVAIRMRNDHWELAAYLPCLRP